MTVTDYPDYDTPQANANAITTTGAPLLVLSNDLANVTSAFTTSATLLPTSSTFYNISQPGYDGFFSIQGATAENYCLVGMAWYDNGIQIALEEYWIAIGTIAAPHIVHFRGPTKGTQLQVTIEGTATCNGTFRLLQNSRIYQRDIWRSFIPQAGGATPASGNTTSLVLASQPITALGAGLSVSYILPLFPGTVWVTMQNESGANGGTIVLTDNGALAGGPSQTVFARDFAAGAETEFQAVLPSDSCKITIKNTGATGSISPTLAVVGLDG